MPLRAVSNASLRDRVADAVREGILQGSLRPGERLTETNLSRQLETSRGPIREALRQLEQEGLVRSYPYRGTEVLGISQAEVEEVLVPIRLIVEQFAFRQAAPRLTEEDVAELTELIHQMRAVGGADGKEQLADLDVRFHQLVMERGDQAQCTQIWKSLQPRIRAFFRRDADDQTGERVAAEHEQLLDALRTGDPEVVATAVRDHVTTYPSALYPKP